MIQELTNHRLALICYIFLDQEWGAYSKFFKTSIIYVYIVYPNLNQDLLFCNFLCL